MRQNIRTDKHEAARDSVTQVKLIHCAQDKICQIIIVIQQYKPRVIKI